MKAYQKHCIATMFMILLVSLFAAGVGFQASYAAESTLYFVSGPDWATFTDDPGNHPSGHGQIWLGAAQNVCLNESSPGNCPADAMFYNYAGVGWTADLSSIPGATWIWAPEITPQTRPADLASYFFSKKFLLLGLPTQGTIYVSGDDFAEVRVNGFVVGGVGSIADIGLAGEAQSFLTSFDITSFLKPGANVITVRGQNGPYFFACLDPPCTYEENPAGVVFGGSLIFEKGPH